MRISLVLTGIDEPAQVLSEKLTSLKVKCDFVALPEYPTITKLRVLSRGQQLIRLDFEDKFENTDPELILFAYGISIAKCSCGDLIGLRERCS